MGSPRRAVPERESSWGARLSPSVRGPLRLCVAALNGAVMPRWVVPLCQRLVELIAPGEGGWSPFP